MLFLGAGASKPLGVPTMKGFTEAVLKDLEKRGAHYEHLVASIKNYISNLGIEPDIEAVLTILEGKANPRKNLENLAAQQMVFPEEFSEASEKTVAWVALNEIEDSIYNICSGVIPQLATRVYAKLWETLSRSLSVPVRGGGRTILQPGSLVKRIFTTNYDLSLEIFLRSQGIIFDEGFRQDASGLSFADEWSRDGVQLVKLHGSINYYLMEGGKVVKSNAPLKHTDIYGERVTEQMMIYPMGEKYATRLPFYELLGQLRSSLFTEPFCIVIGYSFRDTAITNAFLDAVRVNPQLRVMLVSPHADRALESLDPNLRPRVGALSGELGNELLPQAIAEEIALVHPPLF